jgi:hypothetical protein
VPVTAAAAVLLILATVVSPWVGFRPGTRVASKAPEAPLREPELVPPTLTASPSPVAGVPAPTESTPDRLPAGDPMAVVGDSLFDHNEDVEFVLDPVTLRRGRATMTRPDRGAQAEQAVITF